MTLPGSDASVACQAGAASELSCSSSVLEELLLPTRRCGGLLGASPGLPHGPIRRLHGPSLSKYAECLLGLGAEGACLMHVVMDGIWQYPYSPLMDHCL